MTALRRTEACGYTLSDCVTLDELKKLCESGEIAQKIRPAESLFVSYEAVAVSAAQAKRFQNGAALDIARTALKNRSLPNGEKLRVKDPSGNFLGLGIVSDGMIKIFKLFPAV